MTEPRFLIDSNIYIYVLKDDRSKAALNLADCASGSVVTSVIALGEVLRRLPEADRRSPTLLHLFELIPALPFDSQAAEVYARLPFRRASFDRLIAAHALSRGLILVTNNESDFRDIPELTVENWAR